MYADRQSVPPQDVSVVDGYRSCLAGCLCERDRQARAVEKIRSRV